MSGLTDTEINNLSVMYTGDKNRDGSVVEHNELSDLQENMLNQIYQKTLCWISKVAETVEGQYQILNTWRFDGD